MRKFERGLRRLTGLTIGSFIVLRLLNHALDIVSVDAMDRMQDILIRWWWNREAEHKQCKCCVTPVQPLPLTSSRNSISARIGGRRGRSNAIWTWIYPQKGPAVNGASHGHT